MIFGNKQLEVKNEEDGLHNVHEYVYCLINDM